MKKIVILLLILGGVFTGLTKNVVSSDYGHKYSPIRYNRCFRNSAEDGGKFMNSGWICETVSKYCYLVAGNLLDNDSNLTLLYCEDK